MTSNSFPFPTLDSVAKVHHAILYRQYGQPNRPTDIWRDEHFVTT